MVSIFSWQVSIKQLIKSVETPIPSNQRPLSIKTLTTSSLTDSQLNALQAQPDTASSALAVLQCRFCRSEANFSQTNPKECIIRCSENKCKRYICTLERCGHVSGSKVNISRHQQTIHRKKADPDKCHFCKASKQRTGKEVGKCTNCGIFWCLMKQCTYESSEFSGIFKHQNSLLHQTANLPKSQV